MLQESVQLVFFQFAQNRFLKIPPLRARRLLQVTPSGHSLLLTPLFGFGHAGFCPFEPGLDLVDTPIEKMPGLAFAER